MERALKYTPTTKKEQAYAAFAEMGDKIHGLDEKAVKGVVSSIKPFDGSDWTEEEKALFHKEIFRLRKDIKAVSQSMGKDMKSCLTYYLGTYKKSRDYGLAKAVCVDERHEKALSSIHGVDACAICGDGGSLLICDGCEGEYHMNCLRPRLKVIPEGHWVSDVALRAIDHTLSAIRWHLTPRLVKECDECVDKKVLKTRDSIIVNSKLYQRHDLGNKRKADDISDESKTINAASTGEDNMVLRPASPILRKMKAFATNINKAFDIGVVEKSSEAVQ